MNSASYYLRKGEKAIGPLTFSRLIELRDQGKIQSESMIATSGKGPWMTLGELEESLAEPVPAGGALGDQAFGDQGLGGMDLGSLIPPSSPLPNLPWNSAKPSPYSSPAAPLNRQSTKRKREEQTIETEEASTFTRLFLPWAGENSESRYGNLERYISIFKWATRIGFLIGAVLLAILTVILFVALVMVPIQKLNNSSMDMADAEIAFVSRLGGLVLSIVYFALLHLAYIASMALVDFVRLMIDIEGNTRRER
jgi:hypothetical protein